MYIKDYLSEFRTCDLIHKESKNIVFITALKISSLSGIYYWIYDIYVYYITLLSIEKNVARRRKKTIRYKNSSQIRSDY